MSKMRELEYNFDQFQARFRVSGAAVYFVNALLGELKTNTQKESKSKDFQMLVPVDNVANG